MGHVLGIDSGTTGVTALLVDETGAVRAHGYREFPQSFPRPGWVEHDPEDWWHALLDACTQALDAAGVRAPELAAIGITNQRETTVVWERTSLRPIHPAIVWQDRRTAELCDTLRAEGIEDHVRATTGLVVDPYFSGTKIAWLLDNVEGSREAAAAGDLAFGTVDSYVLARLTGVHATDHTNASRTMLFDIQELDWDGALLDRLRIPRTLLPDVQPSSGRFGVTDPDAFFGAAIPVSGIAGDQHAALFGQACFEPGSTKNTYGTGSFVLMNVGGGAPRSPKGLLTTIAFSEESRVEYALEGSIFVTGAAVQWLRDGLGLIEHSDEVTALAESVPDTGDVYFVPALTGLGAPRWDPYARGVIVGLTRGTTRAHIARAAVEAMAFQTRDVVEAMRSEAGVDVRELKADGGASVNDLLLQFQADLLGVPVARPQIRETTALGAAYLAGLAEGVWASRQELAAHWRLDREFLPGDTETADRRYGRWKEAVGRSLRWAQP
ncbi:MAG: glycerol kinase GlpK [Actinomycetota bacterium]